MASDLKWAFLIVFCAYCASQGHAFRKRSIDLIETQPLSKTFRLRRVITPTSYKIKLQPYIAEGYFTGEVRINLTWHRSSAIIALNADQNLKISESDIKVIQFLTGHEMEPGFTPIYVRPTPQNLTVIKMERLRQDQVFFYFEKIVSRGALCELKLIFNGTINENNAGLFRDNYTDISSGQQKWYVASRFKPNFARKVFPCFDEPAYKVAMSISIARTTDMITLSNMPIMFTESKKDQPGWYWDHFQQTPPMSTFTIAFIVSEFRCLERNTTDEINFGLRVCARADYVDSLADVPAKTVRWLQALTEFWGMPLPLVKIDVVALPSFPSSRPGDNWGLLFFRESQLDNKLSYISQELSYQWLGSLSTPQWWNDAPICYALNRYVTAYTSLKMNYMNETINNWPMTMLYSIYYEFSKRHPHWKNTVIKQDSNSAKTEMIFRMLNYTLGEATVVKALQRFMSHTRYETFYAADIWKALTEQAKIDSAITNITINDIAGSWITKERLPVVTVQRDYDKNTASVTQKVYLRERPHDLPDQDTLEWYIPIVLVTEHKLDFHHTKPVTWMDEKTITLQNMPASNQFIIVNPEEIGPFPVNYDSRNWNMIAQFLLTDENRNRIPVNTRAKVLHDAWNLAYAGDLDFGTAFNMTLFLQYEREYVAWNPIFTMIDHIGRHIDSSGVHKKFQAYIRHLLTPLYEELGPKPSTGESDGKAQLRRYSEVFLCQSGYRPCVVEAQKQYSKWMEASNPDEGNIMADEYICPVFKYGTYEEWEFGLQRVINIPASRAKSERTYLLKTLAGCPIDSLKIERLLNVTVLEENGNFTDDDLTLIFSMLTEGSSGYTTLFNFLEKHFVILKAKLEKTKPALWNSLVTSATSVFKTQEGLDMLSRLYNQRKGEFGDVELLVEKAVQRDIKEEIEWSDLNLPVIEKWLDTYLTSHHVDINNTPSS